MTKKADDHAS
ncbi:Protein of unknown function [Thermobacillus xylanilyticus]|uniref:Uncharacterized protein n=1 Tax=Thermobacillus xylanilyticus TaxID=76633 RepID=A0ABM8V2C6_THEXY|nr:Protein of unknown function [Thermobacillus xylanilyticus]